MNRQLKTISIKSYGQYSNDNYGSHTKQVSIGNDLTLYFSYDTIIAFNVKGKLTIIKNYWGTTTGKHLNWIDSDKSIRINQDDFNNALDKTLTEYNL